MPSKALGIVITGDGDSSYSLDMGSFCVHFTFLLQVFGTLMRACVTFSAAILHGTYSFCSGESG